MLTQQQVTSCRATAVVCLQREIELVQERNSYWEQIVITSIKKNNATDYFTK